MQRQTGWLVASAVVAFSGVLCFLGPGVAAPPPAPSPFGNTAVLQEEAVTQLKEVNAQLKELNAYLRSGNLRVTILLPEKNATEKTDEK